MTAYDDIEAQIDPYMIGNRARSAAQIAWFLETIWRVEPEVVADSICDGPGDKGIDGIVIDEDLAEITVLQSKHMTNKTKTQGDSDLKSFYGVAPYFAGPAGVDRLLASGPNAELRNLISRLGLRDLLEQNEYRVQLIFLTNGPADDSATDYIKTLKGTDPTFEFWDQPRLAAVANRTAYPGLLHGKYVLNATSDIIVSQLDADTSMALALVPATELVERLPGIADRSVFDLNVRLNLGGTRINRELGKTVRDSNEHGLFAAYHNGLTLLTHAVTISGKQLRMDGVSVVN